MLTVLFGLNSLFDAFVASIRIYFPHVTSVELNNIFLSEEIFIKTRSKSIKLRFFWPSKFIIIITIPFFNKNFRGSPVRGAHNQHYRGRRAYQPPFHKGFHQQMARSPNFMSAPPHPSFTSSESIPCHICTRIGHSDDECSIFSRSCTFSKSSCNLAAANIFGDNP